MKSFWRFLLWFGISALGALAVGIAAFQRNEPVNALWLVIAGACAFAVSYRFYSAWLMAKVLVLDERRAPPAVTKADGKDYVPTNKWVVFGHHFAAIAGPGPLVGPVLAAQFGYLPGTLWILIGATLGGGVHDAVVLFSSMRREGKSLGQMLKEEINPVIGIVAMFSLLAIMTVLLAVLGLVVVKALAHSPWGLFTIAMTIPLAMIMGLQIRAGLNVTAVSIFGVIGLLACVWGGRMLSPEWNAWLTWSAPNLAWAIMIYGFCASVLPVWLLLAPRDYLSTFMKLGTVALLGIFIVLVAPPLHMPAVTKFVDGSGWVVPGTVFPFVCITIACGAVSGFHSLISSGTTPKLMQAERDIRLVGYGSMVTEMMVALMAIIAACALQPGQYFAINTPADPSRPETLVAAVKKVDAAGFPVTLAEMEQLSKDMGEPTLIGKTGGAPTFAVGMAAMFDTVFKKFGVGHGLLDLWYHFAIMFEALFILTTLDAGTRVGRFILQDLLGTFYKPLGNTGSWLANIIASGALVAAWGYFLYQGAIDPDGIAKSLWPIFGIANQLLAVIAFCLGTTVIIKMGRARYAWCTLAPLVFLVCVTFSAGYLKLFSPKAAGFLPAIETLQGQLAAKAIGGVPMTEAQVQAAQTALTNARVDVGITSLFLVLVAIIVTGCVLEWIKILRGTKVAILREGPYVTLPEAA
ncbi:MAG: carbon starvation CstA family protein [Roseimicrobium sp.]